MSAAPESPSTSPPRRGLFKRLGVTATVLVLLAVGYYAWWFVGMSGGMSGIWYSMQPVPNFTGGEIARARADTTAKLGDVAALVDTVPGLSVRGAGTDDACRQGQHNFKINDPFAYECTLLSTTYFADSGRDPRATLLALQEALTADGWVSSGLYDLPTVVTDYYDVNHGKTVDGSPYLVSDLPSTTYRRGAEDVTIAVVEPRSLGSGLQDFGSRVAASSTYLIPFRENKLPSPTKLAQEILADAPFAVAIQATTVYYRH